MKIKKSEAYRFAQHSVLVAFPCDTKEDREIVLDVLYVLMEDQKVALFTEKREAENNEAV